MLNKKLELERKVLGILNWVKSDLAQEEHPKLGKTYTPYRAEKLKFLRALKKALELPLIGEPIKEVGQFVKSEALGTELDIAHDNLTSNNLIFTATEYEGLTVKSSTEILKFEPNGDIYLYGKLTENDKDVVEGMRKFLQSQGLTK